MNKEHRIPHELEQILKAIILEARKNMIEYDEVIPVVFMQNKNDIKIFPLNYSNDAEKDRTAMILKAASSILKPEYLIFISESWTATGEEALQWKNEHPDESLETCPYAFDAIIFSLETLKGIWMGRAKIEIRDGKRNFDDPKMEFISQAQGRFVNLLHSDVTVTH